MLNLYRRHQSPCRYSSRRYRNCNCPIWVQGSFRGEYIRRALDPRSWSAATDLVRDWEATGEIGMVKKAGTQQPLDRRSGVLRIDNRADDPRGRIGDEIASVMLAVVHFVPLGAGDVGVL
jgi:hypothetical protein